MLYIFHKACKTSKEKYPDMDIYIHYIDLRCFWITKSIIEWPEKRSEVHKGRISRVDSIGDRLEVSG